MGDRMRIIQESRLIQIKEQIIKPRSLFFALLYFFSSLTAWIHPFLFNLLITKNDRYIFLLRKCLQLHYIIIYFFINLSASPCQFICISVQTGLILCKSTFSLFHFCPPSYNNEGGSVDVSLLFLWLPADGGSEYFLLLR